ncbi:MAG: hypothetical protein HYS13_25810 [Planctomycetia bacterium]|nr:hypothetical protein [Planctomycetia bacterium]
MTTRFLAAALFSLALAGALAAQPRETKVRADRENFADDEHWVYNDLPKAIALAKEQSKPLLVVFRCIP